VVAAQQEEVEQFFSRLVGRGRVREAINALQAARELGFVHVGGRVLLQISSPTAPERAQRPKSGALPPRPGVPLVARRRAARRPASPKAPAPSGTTPPDKGRP